MNLKSKVFILTIYYTRLTQCLHKKRRKRPVTQITVNCQL